MLVKGRVQGVGFRATARRHALLFALQGTARNLRDGSVEIYAQGMRHSIEDFLKALNEDAGFGEISEIISKEITPHHSYSDFQIIH